MSTSRKGLKRMGFRRYLVEGQRGTLAIDEDSARRWFVMPPDWPRNGLFAFRFPRPRDARAYAERRVSQ